MHGPEKQPPQKPQSHRGPSVHSPPMTSPASGERPNDGSPSMDRTPPLHSAPPFFTPPGPLPLGPSQPLSPPPDSSQYFHHPKAGGRSEPYGQDVQGQPQSATHSHASHPPPEPYTPSYTQPQYHAGAQVSAEYHGNQQQQQEQQQPSRSRAQFLTTLAHEHGPGRSTGQSSRAGQTGTAPAGVSIAEYNSGGQSGPSEEKPQGPIKKKKKGDEAPWGSGVPSISLR